MNPEQFKSQIRTWLVGGAGIVLGWFASKGWISEQQISAALNSPVAAAAATMIAGAAWSWYNKTTAQLVKQVDALAKDPDSPVKGVIVTATPEGMELANSLPGQTTVPAGTSDARSISA